MEKITETERAALLKFKADYGRTWKQYLLAAWAGQRYGGLNMSGKDGGTLRDIRNQRGPSWLLNLRLK